MVSKLQLCLGLVVLLAVLQTGEGDGKIEMFLIRFKSSCKEHFNTQQCDIYFKICIDKQRTPNVNDCFYKKKTTGHYHNDNSMDFGDNIKGVDNPVVATATTFATSGSSDVMLVVEAWDEDSVTDDDHEATLKKNISYTPKASRNIAVWQSGYTRSGSAHLWFKYRFYCNAYYYTTKCNVYCKARDDSGGHYTCIEGTGQKKCMRGWKGNNCNTDINECQQSVCYQNATCTNYDGWYNCSCPEGYTGQNCDLIDSLCHSRPCQNGGSCSGDMTQYNCTCPFEWTGTNCQTQVNFCNSNPCQNSATCYATVGNYTCACALGWTGYHCTEQVDACDSSPCANGATCTMLPQAEYDCTCTDQYEGENCTTVRNPCEPNPCLNSGTCNKLSYESHNCSCVYGWMGQNCGSFLNTTTDSQTGDDEEDDEDDEFDPLPILIAIICLTVIIVVIIVVLLIRRRRRQRKEVQAWLTDQENRGGGVVPVAGRDNLAFRNNLYDETNRDNSAREAQGNQRPPLPLPTPMCASDDVFSFTKPKMVDDEGQEQGAVGGCNPYYEIAGNKPAGKYVDMKGAVGGGKEHPGGSNQTRLDTRTLAGGGNHYDNPRETPSNPYADFEELKRRSIAVKDTSGYANEPDSLEQMLEAEENHYHDLDDLHLDFQPGDTSPTVTFTPALPASTSHYDAPPTPASTSHYDAPPTPASTPHYDAPRSLSSSSDNARTGNDATPTGNDLAPPPPVAGGYMAMEGATSRDVQLERLESSDDDEDEGEGGDQEDILKLRGEVLQRQDSHSST